MATLGTKVRLCAAGSASMAISLSADRSGASLLSLPMMCLMLCIPRRPLRLGLMGGGLQSSGS
eukprot:543928-Alexandrium_andersonii.AAC.1